MDQRRQALESWLRNAQGLRDFKIEIASGDASFRRYFRATVAGQTSIVMDAPPDKEDCRPYLKVAAAFEQLGLHVPHVRAQDLAQGFLWLADLGDTQYAQALNEDTVDALYGDALRALYRLQTAPKPADVTLPPYDHALLLREMGLFPDWFLAKHLEIAITADERAMLDAAFEQLAHSALAQPQVWVHRDYHSRNLMVIEGNNPGVLDFQDAVVGAITYDLVSLLRDCYVAWPLARVEAWVEGYYQQLLASGQFALPPWPQFLRWFDWMGVQRHLKAIGIFARLNYRDGKPGYLADVPRTLGYVRQVCGKYPELKAFGAFIEGKVVPVLDPRDGRRVRAA